MKKVLRHFWKVLQSIFKDFLIFCTDLQCFYFCRKAVFMFGIVFFFLGSLINALSKDIRMLIAGRTIQGFGGGGVMSMTFILVTDVAPVPLRPRFQSMLAVVYGIASVVGPLLGKSIF